MSVFVDDIVSFLKRDPKAWKLQLNTKADPDDLISVTLDGTKYKEIKLFNASSYIYVIFNEYCLKVNETYPLLTLLDRIKLVRAYRRWRKNVTLTHLLDLQNIIE